MFIRFRNYSLYWINIIIYIFLIKDEYFACLTQNNKKKRWTHVIVYTSQFNKNIIKIHFIIWTNLNLEDFVWYLIIAYEGGTP